MKPRFLLPCLLALCSFTAAAEAQIGVAAGLNFDSLGDIETNSGKSTFDNATGWHLGIFANLGLGPLGLRPGLYYRQANGVELNVLNTTTDFDINLVEIPIDVQLHLGALPILKPYLFAGPVFSFANSDEIEEGLTDFSVAGNLGFGLNLDPPVLPSVFLEMRYAFGVSRLLEERIDFGNNFVLEADAGPKMNSFMLRAGVSF